MLPTEVAALLRERGRLRLDEEVTLARHYHARLHNQGAKFREVELSVELQTRLEQMSFLLKSVAVLINEFSKLRPRNKTQADRRDQLWFMMFLYAEAFYYYAHRVLDILEGESLPHITGLKPCRTIRIIRNALIEHSYGQKTKDFGGSHGAMSVRDGPIVLVRGEREPPRHLRTQDPGLFPNAREFRDNLRPVLSRALEALGGPVPPVETAGSSPA